MAIPPIQKGPVVAGFEACFHDRAKAKDFSAVPQSCSNAEASMASFAQSQPVAAQAIGAALQIRGLEANERNFIATMERTLLCQIGALVVIFFLTSCCPGSRARARRWRHSPGGGGAIG